MAHPGMQLSCRSVVFALHHIQCHQALALHFDTVPACFALPCRKRPACVADLLADVLSSMRAAVRGTGNNNSGASSLVPSIATQPAKGLLLLGRPGVG